MIHIKNNLGLIIVFLLSLIPLINLLTPGLPVAHDSLDHVVRIASFYTNLKEGIFIPRWAGNLNFGFGHPILMFLYPLPSYISSVFHFLGASYVDSFKLTLTSTYILSGIFMYLWLSRFLGNVSAVFGSVLFLYAPYRFIDLYVRGALGEHVAFLFLPLALLSIYLINNLSKNERLRKYYFTFLFSSISFAGLILSHNAISLLFIPFILFYVLYLFFDHKSKLKFVLTLSSLFFGFLFSFFFWFPAFFEGKYTLRDIVTEGVYKDRFVDLADLFYGVWSFGGTGQFSVQIGIIQIIILISSVVLFFKLFRKKDKLKYLYIGTLIYLLISVFLMLHSSNFIWENVSTLQKLQFPWRFLSIAVFTTSLIGALFIYSLNIKRKEVLTSVLIILAIVQTIGFWQAKEYRQIKDFYLEGIIESTTDTGESSPIWSVRFMESHAYSNIEIIEGEGEMVELPRKSTYHEYVIDAKSKIRIRENTLYFPGWKVYDNGKLIESVEFQDPENRGIITFYLDQGMHNIILKFEETKLRYCSNLISLLSLLFIIVVPFLLYLLSKTKVRRLEW